jgi:simple sugar transport system ATP-binding protein
MKVELQGICKRFGAVRANEDVSLTVEAGEIHGLLGENGAGKSTLVKILSGFITHDAGQVALDGAPARVETPADAIRLGVGMLHQDPLDFPPLPVVDNFAAGRHGGLFVDRRAAATELKQLASQFNFDLDTAELVGNLTVGERQQLEILRLLSLGVRVLILDEPTTGISASQKVALFAALKKLAAQGKAIIFVSHKLEDVEELCDRVTVMRRGCVAGVETIPCPTSRLVELMFGRELALPVKPATAQPEAALHLGGLQITDDRIDLRVDDLAVRRGEVVGLAGLEGSGQRLLLLACAGILRPARGSIRVGARELAHRPYRDFLKAGVGYLPADRLREGLVAGLTLQEHVALREPRPGLFVDNRRALADARRAIQTFNIKGQPDSCVERLSGGNQQRAQLALMPPDLRLLLLEHPTRGLDIESTQWVWQQLIERCRAGTAILFASSDLDEIVQYSDRVLVFSGGRMSQPMDAAALTVGQLGQMIGGKFA